MYTDFLASDLQNEIATGYRRKADPSNPITKRKNQLKQSIKNRANTESRDIADVSLDVVQENVGDLQRYVISKGEKPMQNAVDLCLQVALLRQQDIDKIAQTMNVSHSEAEIFLEESESDAARKGTAEADSFIGEVIGAVGNVANRAVSKIVEKKKAQGKPAKFWNTLLDITGGMASSGMPQLVQQEQPNKGGFLNEVKIFGQDVIDAIRKSETKKAVNQSLPLIIGGVLVLILITVLITSSYARRNK